MANNGADWQSQYCGKLDSQQSTLMLLSNSTGPTANTLIVENVGSTSAYVVLGDASIVAAVGSGTKILPHNKIALPIGAATFIGAYGFVHVLYTIQ